MMAMKIKPEILTYEQIEKIVMSSPQGQRALGMGIASAMVNSAIDDMGKVRTRRRLDDWLAALGEQWFQKRKRSRDEARFDVMELEATPEKSSLKDALLRLGRSLDAKEADLMERYGNREAAHA